ncbi:MAG: amidohydrolase family protein [Chloroflexi bacterium]|nr:amidohydrolase family protein [Chloroflexota bacterium]
MAREYRVISGDSHLEVPPDRWTHRVPSKYRESVPRLEPQATGGDAWVVEGEEPREVAFDLYGGKGRDVWQPYGQNYEGTSGTGSPEQRLLEQDKDGVDAEILYPNQAGGPRLWRSIKDDGAYRAMLRAYNDWIAEEYCVIDPERLIGLGLIPWSSIDDALAELQHCAEIGLKGIVLGGFPNGSGHPTPEDDRFWSAALDMKMPITVHIDFDRGPNSNGPMNTLTYPQQPADVVSNLGPMGGMVEQVGRFGRAGAVNIVQMVLSGVFDRFPDLKIFWAENQIGWVPFFMETADVRYKRHIHWAERLLGFKPLQRPPSEYIREHCLWGFQQDRAGVELRHHMGVDRLIWASDFPHQESDWPNSMETLDWNFKGVPADERYKMVAGNVIDFFHLQGRM